MLTESPNLICTFDMTRNTETLKYKHCLPPAHETVCPFTDIRSAIFGTLCFAFAIANLFATIHNLTFRSGPCPAMQHFFSSKYAEAAFAHNWEDSLSLLEKSKMQHAAVTCHTA